MAAPDNSPDPPQSAEPPQGELRTTAVADDLRARELYKYFQPPSATSETPDAPDTVLTAHAQLLAWRLDAQRAMVSLIDRETQYFVAESTKTLYLDDALRHDHPDDANWVLSAAQCVDVPKTGRLCEHTIATLPPPDGGPACFEIGDLTQDDRFNTLEFVRGPPYFRYYVGVPLRTKKGINIGSLFAMDDKPRAPISQSAKHFLGVMGDNVVQHLEMIKEKKDRQRATAMNRCLSAFVDPEHHARPRPRTRASSAQARPAHSKKSANHEDSTSLDSTSLDSDSDSSLTRRVDMDESLHTFARAAELLREGLDVEEGGGGVVFLDTTAARSKQRPSTTNISAGEVSSSQESGKEDQGWRVSVHSTQVKSGNLHASHTRPAAILAQSHIAQKSRLSGGRSQQFLPMSTAELSRLIKRHPRGKRFTFEAGGMLVSSSSDDHTGAAELLAKKRPKRTTASKTETDLLKKSFPTARQIIFLPLWDSTTSRWSACFAYNCSDFRNFSHDPEFLHCIAFSNCVMAEISRLATLIADQQKSDFIGSISHEFRSPLHGILASCEFLGDTECTTFQRSLVDTADGCARTLLDTINMVLDYSKINMLEKNVSKTKASRRDTLWGNASSMSPGLHAHFNIYGDVDIAAITEEVVEGVATGHFFRDSVTNLDVHDFMAADPGSGKVKGTNGLSVQKPNVNIILDISKGEWSFWSQAGALRRVVMNLFGNSLKYTKQGFINVKLDVEHAAQSPQTNISTYVTLTVSDSGQGMSPEYMRTKLFTPFAQESSMTPGTGLGLSLVKSIVNMLNGEIEVTSTQDVGTRITVRLPMSKPTQQISSSGSGSTLSPMGSSAERIKVSSVKMVQKEAAHRTIATYWKASDSDTQGQRDSSLMMRKSVERYLNDWYGFQASTWDKSSTWDIVVTEEVDIHQLIAEAPHLVEPNCKTMVLILRSTTARQMTKSSFPNCDNFEQIRHPFGPYKLARALRICLERLQYVHGLVDSGLDEHVPHIIEYAPKTPLKDITAAVENITLSSSDGSFPDVAIIKNGTLSAREDSINAQMAMTPPANDAPSNRKEEFPFPHPVNKDPRADGTVSPTAEKELLAAPRPSMAPLRHTVSATRQELHTHDVAETNAMSSMGALSNAPPPIPIPATRSPRMLLVDDNRINLKLLLTFMKKRKYINATTAEDGLQAVNAYQALLDRDQPPDIVLMDISMPVMNGFEATRKIREIEREYCAKLPPMQTPPSCLIIALTGLASARDQSEAFTSGFDMYITKPVSFAEISRLLNNWEANGGGAKAEGLPHGAVAAGEGEMGQVTEKADETWKAKEIGERGDNRESEKNSQADGNGKEVIIEVKGDKEVRETKDPEGKETQAKIKREQIGE
ncbi:hypothetical protein K505DRAFT_357404 [Melanomma pulvis-pyrius CBS 109.77]|uniref:histidine kinase n=1 Tax=Melanomma pulvis-pyrius CBS 109.77 TaxID=1314802 RepID=A0A6A6XQU9_9PLEO|nr:hypothetical protein K505DRAFT_357404 [Melanomma pulvis-pyrius CBS 109.77]